MTLQQTVRRSDQPIHIEIGPRHGYRIEGDHALLHAELQVPPHRAGGPWALELWATEQPHREGPLTGIRIAQVALELPTPIAAYVHEVDTRTSARLPLQGRPYAMVLALTQRGPEGQERVHAFTNYARPQSFSAPHLEGAVGYRVLGDEVVLEADGIFNPRPDDNRSGTLSLELWAFPEADPAGEGVRLAAAEIECVAGQARLPAIERRVAFSEPPVGRSRLALLLCEWTHAHGYLARDRRDFACVYERTAPESADSSSSRSPAVAVASPLRPVDRLRLVPTIEAPEAPAPETQTETATAKATDVAPRPTVAPAVAEPLPLEPAVVAATPAGGGRSIRATASSPGVSEPSSERQREAPAPVARGLVSIQTATVDELAQVNGLNLKLAKEIIKARPFASLSDLIRVRGIGEKTLVRLKGLLKL